MLAEAPTLDMEQEPVSSSDAPSDNICERMCEFWTEIDCNPDNDACLSQCRADMVDGRCYPERRAASLCLIDAGAEAFSCVNGRAFVKAGYCEEEKHAQTICLNGSSR